MPFDHVLSHVRQVRRFCIAKIAMQLKSNVNDQKKERKNEKYLKTHQHYYQISMDILHYQTY
ncbi:CLUMA_CG016936, isoform A [Clunio marinus]|uniref:CLUMA_CG016936, isoform A n=1 Tax=Clunio marinus TaxID=568069 RepID=A0A1J1IS84_9DIPT|nr:CLUMA_CG016936, isoform A [Clunio marinus]